jgi:hypothetical protein
MSANRGDKRKTRPPELLVAHAPGEFFEMPGCEGTRVHACARTDNGCESPNEEAKA